MSSLLAIRRRVAAAINPASSPARARGDDHAATVPEGSGSGASFDSATVHRALALVAVGGLFGPLLQAWGVIVTAPATGLAIVALGGAALVLLCTITAARNESELARLDRWVLALGLLVLAAWAASQLRRSSGYASDEAAFLQGAAERLIHGHDPYGASLSSSLSAYAVPPAFWTYTTTGSAVSTLGYPALPVLLLAPFVQLTGGGQAVPIADFCLLSLGVWALHRTLPGTLRPLAVLVGVGLPSLLSFSLSGMTQIMMLAALVAAVHRWTEIGADGVLGGRGRHSALALGLAISTNQLAWFLTPFLLAGIVLARRPTFGTARAVRLAARYAALAAVPFAVVNLPFAIWGPEAWLRGVLDPLLQHALPYGQGLVSFTQFAGAGGGAIELLSVGGALVYVALLVLFAAEFPRLHRGVLMLPMLALFVSGRSLAGYWMMLLPVMVLAALAPSPAPAPAEPPEAGWRSARRRLALVAAFLPAAVCLLVALATPAPLELTVLSTRSDATARSVDEMSVAVRNTSSDPLRAFFATDTRGQMTAFWRVVSGPRTLAPGAAATYLLRQDDTTSMPANGSPFVLQAVTDAPRTISTSGRYSAAGPAPSDW